jgi:ubiquinone/menaquinone biosynthesis C-methylase UbiE
MIRFILLLALFCAPAVPQVAKEANRNYQTKEGRDVIAAFLSDPHRREVQRPHDIIDFMAIQPGMTVADVGTGTGFMLVYLSHAVGDKGKVIAEDIYPDFLEAAKLKALAVGLKNVEFVLGTDRDPNLPGDTLDRVLTLDVYHHFDYPEAMLKGIRDSLLSDGKFYIVDFYKAAAPNGDPNHIRLDRDAVIKEVESNGFKLTAKSDIVPQRQYILAFEKR